MIEAAEAAAAPVAPDFVSLMDDDISEGVLAAAGGSSGSGGEAEARTSARRLAEALGLALGDFAEDPGGDPAFADGLLEAIGLDAARILREARIDLEEDEERVADAADAAAEEAGDEPEASSYGEQAAGEAVGVELAAAGPIAPVGGIDLATAAAVPIAPVAEVAAAEELIAPIAEVAAAAASSSAPIPAAAGPAAAESGITHGEDDMFKKARKEFMHGCEIEFTGFSAGVAAIVQGSMGAGPELGVPHKVSGGSLKATCKIKAHHKCGCWVSRRETSEAVVAADLFKWFCDGVTQDEHSHWRASQASKKAHGMTVPAAK